MSGTVNKVILIGHLGDEVKMHYFEGGNCLGRFPIATNEEYTNRDGDRVKTTEWHNIVVRNKGAEICEKYLSKGDKIYIEGRIKTRKWTGDDGIERYSTEIECRDFTFLTPKGESSAKASDSVGNSMEQGQNPGKSAPKPEQPNTASGDDADDLPF